MYSQRQLRGNYSQLHSTTSKKREYIKKTDSFEKFRQYGLIVNVYKKGSQRKENSTQRVQSTSARLANNSKKVKYSVPTKLTLRRPKEPRLHVLAPDFRDVTIDSSTTLHRPSQLLAKNSMGSGVQRFTRGYLNIGQGEGLNLRPQASNALTNSNVDPFSQSRPNFRKNVNELEKPENRRVARFSHQMQKPDNGQESFNRTTQNWTKPKKKTVKNDARKEEPEELERRLLDIPMSSSHLLSQGFEKKNEPTTVKAKDPPNTVRSHFDMETRPVSEFMPYLRSKYDKKNKEWSSQVIVKEQVMRGLKVTRKTIQNFNAGSDKMERASQRMMRSIVEKDGPKNLSAIYFQNTKMTTEKKRRENTEGRGEIGGQREQEENAIFDSNIKNTRKKTYVHKGQEAGTNNRGMGNLETGDDQPKQLRMSESRMRKNAEKLRNPDKKAKQEKADEVRFQTPLKLENRTKREHKGPAEGPNQQRSGEKIRNQRPNLIQPHDRPKISEKGINKTEKIQRPQAKSDRHIIVDDQGIKTVILADSKIEEIPLEENKVRMKEKAPKRRKLEDNEARIREVKSVKRETKRNNKKNPIGDGDEEPNQTKQTRKEGNQLRRPTDGSEETKPINYQKVKKNENVISEEKVNSDKIIIKFDTWKSDFEKPKDKFKDKRTERLKQEPSVEYIETELEKHSPVRIRSEKSISNLNRTPAKDPVNRPITDGIDEPNRGIQQISAVLLEKNLSSSAGKKEKIESGEKIGETPEATQIEQENEIKSEISCDDPQAAETENVVNETEKDETATEKVEGEGSPDKDKILSKSESEAPKSDEIGSEKFEKEDDENETEQNTGKPGQAEPEEALRKSTHESEVEIENPERVESQITKKDAEKLEAAVDEFEEESDAGKNQNEKATSDVESIKSNEPNREKHETDEKDPSSEEQPKVSPDADSQKETPKSPEPKADQESIKDEMDEFEGFRKLNEEDSKDDETGPSEKSHPQNWEMETPVKPSPNRPGLCSGAKVESEGKKTTTDSNFKDFKSRQEIYHEELNEIIPVKKVNTVDESKFNRSLGDRTQAQSPAPNPPSNFISTPIFFKNNSKEQKIENEQTEEEQQIKRESIISGPAKGLAGNSSSSFGMSVVGLKSNGNFDPSENELDNEESPLNPENSESQLIVSKISEEEANESGTQLNADESDGDREQIEEDGPIEEDEEYVTDSLELGDLGIKTNELNIPVDQSDIRINLDKSEQNEQAGSRQRESESGPFGEDDSILYSESENGRIEPSGTDFKRKDADKDEAEDLDTFKKNESNLFEDDSMEENEAEEPIGEEKADKGKEEDPEQEERVSIYSDEADSREASKQSERGQASPREGGPSRVKSGSDLLASESQLIESKTNFENQKSDSDLMKNEGSLDDELMYGNDQDSQLMSRSASERSKAESEEIDPKREKSEDEVKEAESADETGRGGAEVGDKKDEDTPAEGKEEAEDKDNLECKDEELEPFEKKDEKEREFDQQEAGVQESLGVATSSLNGEEHQLSDVFETESENNASINVKTDHANDTENNETGEMPSEAPQPDAEDPPKPEKSVVIESDKANSEDEDATEVESSTEEDRIIDRGVSLVKLKDGSSFVGDVDQGGQPVSGVLLSADKELIYAGNFAEGLRHGHGLFFYPQLSEFIENFEDRSGHKNVLEIVNYLKGASCEVESEKESIDREDLKIAYSNLTREVLKDSLKNHIIKRVLSHCPEFERKTPEIEGSDEHEATQEDIKRDNEIMENIEYDLSRKKLFEYLSEVQKTDYLRFEGPFVDGEPQGFGKMFLKNGAIVRGRFENGRVEGPAMIMLCVSEGEFLEKLFDGNRDSSFSEQFNDNLVIFEDYEDAYWEEDIKSGLNGKPNIILLMSEFKSGQLNKIF